MVQGTLGTTGAAPFKTHAQHLTQIPHQAREVFRLPPIDRSTPDREITAFQIDDRSIFLVTGLGGEDHVCQSRSGIGEMVVDHQQLEVLERFCDTRVLRRVEAGKDQRLGAAANHLLIAVASVARHHPDRL